MHMYKYVHMIYICKSTPEKGDRQAERDGCDRHTDRQRETGAIDTQTARTKRKIDCPPVPM